MSAMADVVNRNGCPGCFGDVTDGRCGDCGTTWTADEQRPLVTDAPPIWTPAPVAPDPAAEPDPFEMLYCDDARCRVNTFERGRRQDQPQVPRPDGLCPGCDSPGLPIPTRG